MTVEGQLRALNRDNYQERAELGRVRKILRNQKSRLADYFEEVQSTPHQPASAAADGQRNSSPARSRAGTPMSERNAAGGNHKNMSQ